MIRQRVGKQVYTDCRLGGCRRGRSTLGGVPGARGGGWFEDEWFSTQGLLSASASASASAAAAAAAALPPHPLLHCEHFDVCTRAPFLNYLHGRNAIFSIQVPVWLFSFIAYPEKPCKMDAALGSILLPIFYISIRRLGFVRGSPPWLSNNSLCGYLLQLHYEYTNTRLSRC